MRTNSKFFFGFLVACCFADIGFAQTGPRIIWSVLESDATTAGGAAVAFSPDGQLIATGRRDSNDVKIRKATDGKLIRTLNGANNDANVIAFSPDGQYLATGTGGGGHTLNLNLWRVSDGARVVGRIHAFNNGTNSLSFSPDGQLLVVSGFSTAQYKIFHVPDMSLLATVDNFDPEFGYNVRVNAVAFSTDGQLIGVGDTRGVRLRRASDGSLVRTMNTNAPNVMKTESVAFSPNGLYIAAGVAARDLTYGTCIDCAVKLFQISDGALVRVYENGNNMGFPKVAFSPNGQVIAAEYSYPNADDNGGAVHFWDVATAGTIRIDARSPWFHDFAYSPFGAAYAFFGADGLIGVAATSDPWGRR
jgi:WD40 repeat protein